MSNDMLVVFDFENILVSLQEQYQLTLTEDGFKRILDYIKTLGNVENKNILVGAYWDNFRYHKNFIIKTGTKKVDVPINTKNAADGALIIEVMKSKMIETLDSISTVILLAGDGGYGSLIYYLYEENKQIHIFSVKGCTKDELKELGSHYWIEDILEIQDSSNFNNNYTAKTTLLPEWDAIITKAKFLNKQPYLDKAFFVNQIYRSHITCNSLNPYDTKEKCRRLLEDCCNAGLFIVDKRFDENGKMISIIKLNLEHFLLN